MQDYVKELTSQYDVNKKECEAYEKGFDSITEQMEEA